MTYKIRGTIDAIRTLAFGGIGAAYAVVGAVLAGPVRLICFNNLTNQNLYFSDDGVNDKVIIPLGTGKVFDISTNRTRQENFFLKEGDFCYIRHLGVAPTSGSVYIEIVR